MITKQEATFNKDIANKKITVVKEFDAPIDQVWKAWTDRTILDQWWGPKPWKAETKSMDFREGGQWLYAMVGPQGERHWSFANYQKIVPKKSFTGLDGFCDENGKPNEEMPRMQWHVAFDAKGDTTVVTINITFSSEEDLNKIIEMGFKEGFAMGLGQLDEILAK